MTEPTCLTRCFQPFTDRALTSLRPFNEFTRFRFPFPAFHLVGPKRTAGFARSQVRSARFRYAPDSSIEFKFEKGIETGVEYKKNSE